jgi:hypothetical protein
MAMFSKLFQRIAAKRLEKRILTHFEKATGPVLHRQAVAVAMIEVEDSWVSQARAEFSADEQPIFLMAYQCFILWVLTHALRERLQPAELDDLTNSVRVAFARSPYHTPAIFDKIWPSTQQLMPIALQGGSHTGGVYPLPHIILAATLAGYPLPLPQKFLDYRWGVHVLFAMKRIAETFSPDRSPDA